jgi:hypothetical protein
MTEFDIDDLCAPLGFHLGTAVEWLLHDVSYPHNARKHLLKHQAAKANGRIWGNSCDDMVDDVSARKRHGTIVFGTVDHEAFLEWCDRNHTTAAQRAVCCILNNDIDGALSVVEAILARSEA